MACPHAVIRAKVVDPELLKDAPPTLKHMPAKWRQFKGMEYLLQVAPEDCTGCGLCVEACPAVDKKDPSRKAINMRPQPPLREQEAENWEFFLSLPDTPRQELKFNVVKDVQLLEPLIEFSGACA